MYSDAGSVAHAIKTRYKVRSALSRRAFMSFPLRGNYPVFVGTQPPADLAQRRRRLPQAGVDLVQRGRARTQRLFAERVERRFDGVEMGVQILGLRIDIQ